MKILFINDFQRPDYQNDMIFHGLKSLYGKDVSESHFAWYMYKKSMKEHWNSKIPNNGNSYGLGFTMHGTLDDSLSNQDTRFAYKIKNREYDKIVYGSITRCSIYLDLVLDNYDYNDIIFINGEDQTDIDYKLAQKGKYFKRELTIDDDFLIPVGFCIPKEKIVDKIPKKTKDAATNIPGDASTYIFTDEDSFNKDYQMSKYGLTFKKGGWDCLRHYQILLNGCIPDFPDLKQCPNKTMTFFPKEIVKQVTKFESDKEYNRIANELLAWTRTHLTTEAMAKYVIEYEKNV